MSSKNTNSSEFKKQAPNNVLFTYNHLLFLIVIPPLLFLIFNLNLTVTFLSVGAATVAVRFLWPSRPVYLVDFACYKPPDEHKVTREIFMRQFTSSGTFTEDSIAFQRRMLERSGLGQETYMPKSLLTLPLTLCEKTAREEASMVIFGAIDLLLRKTGVKAGEIGVLVVNCSLYGPTPSLSGMIVNRYRMRGDVRSFNLGGMGCSAGLISVDLAKQLLQVHRDTYALVVSTESMTLNPYFGNTRSMLVTNSLFRMGGAALLLSNRRASSKTSKYRLLHSIIRTHTASVPRSHSAVTLEEDCDGNVGVSLSKDLMSVASHALKSNLTSLGPKVLPLTEQLKFLVKNRYVPDFRTAFDHFCVHAGGRAVLEELERSLRLGEESMEPSTMTLYRFGNTSSSSLWYELAYLEAKGRVRRGDKVWQIAFGSGFKCNSAAWEVVRSVGEKEEGNPWREEIDKYPVHVPKVVSVN